MLSSDTVVSWCWSKLSTSKHDNSHNKARIGLILAELRWGRGCTGSAGCLRVWERYGKVEREGLVLYLQMASRKPGVGQSEFVEASSHSSSHNRPSFRLRIASFRPSSLWMRERVSRVSLSTDERWSVSFSRSKQSRVGKNSVHFAAKTSVSSVKRLKQVCVVVSEVAGASRCSTGRWLLCEKTKVL